jgi:hypothetical protein
MRKIHPIMFLRLTPSCFDIPQQITLSPSRADSYNNREVATLSR